jgi:hypothetical protein
VQLLRPVLARASGAQVAKTAPGGYPFLVTTSAYMVNPVLYANADYDHPRRQYQSRVIAGHIPCFI